MVVYGRHRWRSMVVQSMLQQYSSIHPRVLQQGYTRPLVGFFVLKTLGYYSAGSLGKKWSMASILSSRSQQALLSRRFLPATKDSCFATSSFSPFDSCSENKCQWLSGYCGTVFGRANCSDELLTFDMVERTGVEKTSVVCTLILDFRATEQNTTRRVMLLNYTRYSAGCTSIYWGMLLSFTLLCT
ncbi:uncharacterized protein [Lolium perenne]|uniref:uncharacterized protein isoform X2 n=1 Tax=Lolium perenne TaxID=4522 RepID=UPI0021F64B33|nr:uncharacterized protein LOC127317706 isoform X2 [Lolium perenne]